MNKSLKFLTAAVVPILAVACSTPETTMNTGDRISQRGDDIGAYGAAWSEGRSDVKQGERMVQEYNEKLIDAEKDLARARDRVATAERRIAEARNNQSAGQQLIQGGNRQMQQAEDDYSLIQAGPPAISPED